MTPTAEEEEAATGRSDSTTVTFHMGGGATDTGLFDNYTMYLLNTNTTYIRQLRHILVEYRHAATRPPLHNSRTLVEFGEEPMAPTLLAHRVLVE